MIEKKGSDTEGGNENKGKENIMEDVREKTKLDLHICGNEQYISPHCLEHRIQSPAMLLHDN